MAITRLLRIKETKGKSKSTHLKRNIFYICNPEKTGGGLWIGGNAGCLPDIVYQTMMQNKEFWDKKNGSQGFHYMLSFPPDCGIDEALAYQITEEFCKELLGDNYYHVFAVHNDKEHMHSHITFDSVSKTDGKKFHSPRGDWAKRIQPITDRLCEKYHLPTLQYEQSEKRGTDYGEWKKLKMENAHDYYTWNDIIRDDIDEAIHFSENMDEFLAYLKANHYEVRNKKYLSLKPQGRLRPIRSGRLGIGYSKNEIIARLKNKKLNPEIQYRYKTYGNRDQMREIIFMKITHTPGWKMTPFQKQFFRKWNNTYFIRKPGHVRPGNYRQDILEVQKLSEGINYMIDYNIGCKEDLLARRNQIEKEADALQLRLQSLRTVLYRNQPNYLLREYEKLQEAYERRPTAETKEKMKRIKAKIELVCPLEEAIRRRDVQKGEIAECRKVIRDAKKEMKLIDDILNLHYEFGLPSENQDADRHRTDSVLIRQENQNKPHTKVTINRKLFRDVNIKNDFLITKVPYLKNCYVEIPAADCYLYGSGEILSAYLYDDKKYQLKNSAGDVTGTISGSDLKTHYEDKTKERRPGR